MRDTARNERDYPRKSAFTPSPRLAWTILIVGVVALVVGIAAFWMGADLQRRALENMPNPH